jgi:SHS2 domain-containing protein
MPFELIPHSSDMGVRGIGKTVEEAFAEAARAMFSLMANLERVEPKEAIPFKVEADSLENLFVSFLGELLFLRDVHGMLFRHFELRLKEEGPRFLLEGVAYGEKFDPRKHEPGIDVKAATYAWVKVEKTDGTWIAQGVVDV